MKKMYYTLAAALLFGMTACQQTPAALTVTGDVQDATMNNISLVTTEGETVNISTMDADPAQVPGVLIGDNVTITYELQKPDGTTEVKQATALTVNTHSPYFYIAGTWVEPNPIDATAVQGVTLNTDGTAASVGMATLLFKNWSLDGNILSLTSESIGNKVTTTITDSLQIVKIDQDSLVLAAPTGDIVWSFARQQ